MVTEGNNPRRIEVIRSTTILPAKKDAKERCSTLGKLWVRSGGGSLSPTISELKVRATPHRKVEPAYGYWHPEAGLPL